MLDKGFCLVTGSMMGVAPTDLKKAMERRQSDYSIEKLTVWN
jgi:hypothetical protein